MTVAEEPCRARWLPEATGWAVIRSAWGDAVPYLVTYIEDAGDRGPRVAEELTWRATLGAHVRAEHWLSGSARAPSCAA